MATPRPWLPKEAFTGPAAVAPLADVLNGWTAEWLAKGRATLPYAWAPHDRTFPLHAPSRDTGGDGKGFALAIALRGEATLAAALLGCDTTNQPPRSAGDSALIRHLTEAARADLWQRIGEHFAPYAAELPENPSPAYCLPIAFDEGADIFILTAQETVLIAAARAAAGLPRKRPALAHRMDALANQPIALAPVLGCNRIALAELEKLGTGDVIPLDTPIDATLDLAIGGRARAAQAAMIALSGGRLEIRIERPIQEW